jgi:sucrose-6-phosphate hydrolase SacC (GH32 family)
VFSRRRFLPLFIVSAVVLLPGCGNYADFALPAANGAGPKAPFLWQPAAQPVLGHGAMSDVLNPSVIRFTGPDGPQTYWNFYSEFDGQTWHTAAATSGDGITWARQGRILSPEGLQNKSSWEGDYIAANGSAVVKDGEILYWYQAGRPPRIALARSRDGRTWTKSSDAVVPLGPRGSFDERGVADPYVILSGDYFYLFYLGQDRAAVQRIGIARSHDGVTWQKLRSNPILELGAPHTFDEDGLGEPAVWSSGGQWWMLYTGRSRRDEQNNEPRKLGLARSPDGVHWERVPDFVVNQHGPITGTETWNSQVICDPTIEQMPDGSIRVWFGGGDVGSPDEKLDGQIGVGVLRGL